MIQPAVTMISAGPSQAIGKINGTSVESAENGGFSAILEGSDGLAAEPESPSAGIEGALLALVRPVAGGNSGKPGGKILPDIAPGETAADEADGDTMGDDSESSLVFAPVADPAVVLASLTPLAQVAEAPATRFTASPASARPDAAIDPLAAAGQGTPAPALAPIAANPGTSAIAPQPGTGTVELPRQAAGTGEAAPVSAAVTAARLAPIEVVAAPDTITPATTPQPATNAQLAARVPAAAIETITQPAATPVQAAGEQAVRMVAAAAPDAQTGTNERARSPRATVASAPASALTTPAPAPAPPPASPMPLVADAAMMQAPFTPVTETSASALATPAAEGPQDFATLVARLNEAREAATPHVVRTALNHAEFGRISLQFRHEDSALAVTMANSDPGFASAVQVAASASLAGGAGNRNDDAQQQQQGNFDQSRQQGAAAQGGAGNGNGGQNQQARADQAGQTFNRGSGTASRPQHEQEAPASRPGRDGTRQGSGIYA